MADAKVIPFDDDRSRTGGSARPARRRPSGGGGRGPTAASAVGTAAVSALPGQQDASKQPQGPQRAGQQGVEPDGRGGWDRRIAGGLAFLRRRVTGEYDVDEFGYDEELTDQVLMSMLRPVYEKYFRVEVKGIENIPSEGGALIVSNHSGTLPLDGLMLQVAVHDNHPAGGICGCSPLISFSCCRW